ncbi:MAG TPA: surface-adhesin E family protein [Thermodesulfobacteriota bacterium]|nr:surface-adhesin E family protein [Thermodesulfobacteriota bacterium]
MKSLWVNLLCIGLIFCFNVEVWGADWKLFAETNSYECFYDAEDAAPSPNDIVDVWTKLEYTKEGISGIVKKFGEHYADLCYSLELWEINCGEKKERILSITEYSAEGKILYASSAEGRPTWKIIPRQSVDESLYKAVCK